MIQVLTKSSLLGIWIDVYKNNKLVYSTTVNDSTLVQAKVQAIKALLKVK